MPEDTFVCCENKSFRFLEREPDKFEIVEIEPGMIKEGFQVIGRSDIGAESKIVIRNAYALLMKI